MFHAEIINSDTSSTKYKLNIKTQGQLLLSDKNDASNESNEKEGNVDVSYQEDEYPKDVYYIQIIFLPTDDLSERVFYLNISSKKDN